MVCAITTILMTCIGAVLLLMNRDSTLSLYLISIACFLSAIIYSAFGRYPNKIESPRQWFFAYISILIVVIVAMFGSLSASYDVLRWALSQGRLTLSPIDVTDVNRTIECKIMLVGHLLICLIWTPLTIRRLVGRKVNPGRKDRTLHNADEAIT